MALALPIPRGRRKFARIECNDRGRECTIHTHGVLKLGTAEPNAAHVGICRTKLGGERAHSRLSVLSIGSAVTHTN